MASTASYDPEVAVRDSFAAATKFAEQSGYSSVYVGGAPFAGLGSPKSDTDIFVVVESKPGETEQVYQDGARLDVEFITWSRLEGLVEHVRDFSVTRLDMTQMTAASRSSLDFLSRFQLGAIVVDADERLASLQERLSDGNSRFRDLLIARHALDVANSAEDVVGALMNGDLECADYEARESLYLAAEALLASKGDSYVNIKWVWARWRRTIGDSLGVDVSRVIDSPFDPVKDVAIARARALAQDLLVMAISRIDYLPYISQPKSGSATRDVSVSPIATVEGALILRDIEEGVELSNQGLLLWGLAYGRSRNSTLDLAQNLIHEHFGETVELDEIGQYYDQLVDVGLLRLVE